MTTRDEVRSLLGRHELRLKRSLGQSFLVDDRALESIASAAMRGGEDTVVEIGAGLGTLTTRLAARAKRVVTIERDRTLIPVLEDLLAPHENVSVVEGDALEQDYAALAGPGSRPAIAGNIPYSITTPILLQLLEQRASIGTVTLMIQREVAQRLAAEPNTREYGSLTILFRLHADVAELFEVGPESFLPSPKVSSTVLGLRWLDAPRVPVADPKHLERVVRASFSQRRKTLRNSLSTAFDKPVIEAAAKQAEIVLERRAETLTLTEFARLASFLPQVSAAPGSPSDP